MPNPGRWESSTLKLYQRCRERRALPFAGGVMDQPEDIMQAFDVIDEAIASKKKRDQESDSREMEFQKMREGLHGGR